MADSDLGVVWKLDTNVEKVIDVDETNPSPSMPMGVNGIKIRDGFLCWSNTGPKLFCGVKVDGHGKAIGDVEILEKEIVIADFVFDRKGNSWVCCHSENTLGVIRKVG